MSDHDAQTSRTRSYLELSSRGELFDFEFVTDDVLQVVLYLDVREHRVDNAPWLLAELVDYTATLVERNTGNPFNAFVTLFTQAWDMRCMRPTNKRKGPRRY